jgi:hypothetical protein
MLVLRHFLQHGAQTQSILRCIHSMLWHMHGASLIISKRETTRKHAYELMIQLLIVLGYSG